MRLVEFRVRKFRNILDSTDVAVDPHVTCFVGKNESGKTAALQALDLLHPARPKGFSILEQYPAWLEKRDRQAGEDLASFQPITAVFELEESDRTALHDKFGAGAVRSDTLSVSRSYAGQLTYTFDADEKAALAHTLEGSRPRSSVAAEVKKAETFESLEQLIGQLESSSQDKADDAADLRSRVEAVVGKQPFREAIESVLLKRLPKLLYFDQYSQLPGVVPIATVLEADPATLDDGLLTARALLRLAAADDQYLMDPDYEVRKRELENVANALTHDVLGYWSQNPELSVQIDITQKKADDEPGHPRSALDELRIRMYDARHMLSLPFDERSTGFRWFFSFLAAFSEYEFEDNPVIILLDEAALGLHARAQKDFLRFIEERVAVKHQVLYTTHSPFMVQPDHLERVRLVEDKGRESGAQISQDALSIDPDTLFPLQGALGYDVAQHLFVAPHDLIVESTSDFTYLVVMSDYLREHGRASLDDRWSIVPTGGGDSIAALLALLGMQREMTVVVGARRVGHQQLAALAYKGYLAGTTIVTVGDVLGRGEADVEDLFTVDDYLLLYNEAFSTSIRTEDLDGSELRAARVALLEDHEDRGGTYPIVRRLARYAGVEWFDHGRPADVLLRRRNDFLPKMSDNTLDRFGRLFGRVNETLPPQT